MYKENNIQVSKNPKNKILNGKNKESLNKTKKFIINYKLILKIVIKMKKK